jgi:pyruvate/2-oxoglutarate dehydrogenase complex dihydrolipoamide dehydrogenase (E3) component
VQHFIKKQQNKYTMNSFDVVIISSGPGGYVSAIVVHNLVSKPAIIEKYSTLGELVLT